jgi:exopolysaccharide biosynthesis polyprenyl glycosylphosphotransferase
LLFLFAWHLIFSLSALYASRRLSNRRDEVVDVIKATSLGAVVIFVAAFVFSIRMITPFFLLVFWLTSTLLTVSARLVLRMALTFIRTRGRNLRDIIIIGTNSRALEFARRLVSRPELGCRIAGFVDQEWDGTALFRSSGFALASDFGDFPRFLRETVVDEVVVALPFRSMHAQAALIAALCEEQGITVRVLTSIFDLKLARSFAEELEGDALITHSTGRVEGWPIFAKRVLDLTISATVIICFSPILLVVAVLIKILSPGPVFFVQKRLGLNKRHFKVYKFRTMVADAEQRMGEIEHLNEVSGPVFKIKHDPRVTSFGRFLRKTSIDELPQLFNVLKGNMSLVGPRPLPIRDYKGFSEDWQRRRFSVKPGLTCLWQVRGRSSIPFDKWMELDLQYIDKWSLRLDFQILLLTIPAVLRGSGAA